MVLDGENAGFDRNAWIKNDTTKRPVQGPKGEKAPNKPKKAPRKSGETQDGTKKASKGRAPGHQKGKRKRSLLEEPQQKHQLKCENTRSVRQKDSGGGTQGTPFQSNAAAAAGANAVVTATEHDLENHTLVMVPFEPTKFTDTIADYESPNLRNELETPEYATDIYQRLHEAEVSHLWDMAFITKYLFDSFLRSRVDLFHSYSQDRYRVRPYTFDQQQLNSKMRHILVDWLCLVHFKFQLVPETLHLCIHIVDRYCAVMHVTRKNFQCVGISAMLIASTYEEIYPPEMNDLTYAVNYEYDAREILDMETKILVALDYRISAPTGYNFLQRFLFVSQASRLMSYAASYYLERALQVEDVLGLRPSEVAAAAVCLAIGHPKVQHVAYDPEVMVSNDE